MAEGSQIAGGGRKGRVIVCGIIFGIPIAGVVWQFLHYLIGLRRLGYDAYYVEATGRWVYDPEINDYTQDGESNVRAMARVLEAHGLADRWAYRGLNNQKFGLDDAKLAALCRDADALLNVTGSQPIDGGLERVPLRIYVESDPFSSQVRVAQRHERMLRNLDHHNRHFTFGENIGAPDCDIPLGRYDWMPTCQPVLIDVWESSAASARAAYNTITTWEHTNKNVEWNGQTYYWTKGRELEKFIDLPRHRPQVQFELALKGGEQVRARLCDFGWNVINADTVSRDLDVYRSYIQQARAEFTIAREQYVKPRTGWFSDRTACYLAAAKPVVTQDTGFGNVMPTGKGLFAFSSMEGAAAAVDAIESDYSGNCRAAREIAVEHFAAEKVLGSLLSRAGL